MCRVEPIAASQRAAARARADAQCSLDAKLLPQLLARRDTVLVDARPDPARQRSRLPDALPWSAAEIKTQPALRASHLVLVGDGKHDAALLEQCTQLKAAGFSRVSVLRAGILAWVQAGRPLIADADARAQLQRLNDTELLQAALGGEHRILVAPAARAFTALLPGTQALPGDDTTQIAAALKRPRSGRPTDAVVLVTATPLPAATLEAVSKAAPLPVFAYAGEPAAFERFLRGQVAIWKRAEGGERVRCPGL